MGRNDIQDDVAAFLAAGGTIQQCEIGQSAGIDALAMTRRELIAHRKRLDTVAIIVMA
jgi:hypothetical protein